MNKKVTLKPITPNTIYFPSTDEFAQFLGMGTSARAKANIFKGLLPSELRISPRSLDNLGKQGIKEKTARRAAWPVLRFLFKNGLLQYFKGLPKVFRTTEVIYAWRMPLLTFNHINSGINLKLMHSFLDYRNELYQPIKQFIDSSPKLTADNQTELLTSFYQLALPKTLLTEEEQNELYRVIASGDIEGETTENTRRFVQYWTYDFHLSLMAALDITILHNADIVDKYHCGIFGHILMKDGATYFSRLLNHFNEISGFNDYQLARFIPIDRASDHEHTTLLHEAKSNTLKKWRSGKTKPETKTITCFFENVNSEAYSLPIVLVAKLCLALDRQLENVKGSPWEEGFLATFSAKRYEIYFQHFKKKLPELAA